MSDWRELAGCTLRLLDLHSLRDRQSFKEPENIIHEAFLTVDRAAREDVAKFVEENFDEDSNALTIAAAIRASIKP